MHMHIFFSGIGGTGIGPLALVAQQAGYEVGGSDKQDSLYIKYLREHGISDITIGQNYDEIADAHAKNPIDWFVYSSAVAIEQPDSPELKFCAEHNIRTSKRDELLNQIIKNENLKLIAIAGTHGKTTTTAMTIFAMSQLGLPLGYILPAKTSFAEMGAFEKDAQYFIYEADEFDRNFLHFEPKMSLITGIDWDHPDTYPTREDYQSAFRQFISQSERSILWVDDVERLGLKTDNRHVVINENDPKINEDFSLAGLVNRQDARQVAQALHELLGEPLGKLAEILNKFPGVSRRFEQIVPGLFSDYAHTPPKIRGALQLAHEVSSNVVVVYEGLHNTRQHFIKGELKNLFDGVKNLYIVPSYLAREDKNLELLTPADLKLLLSSETQAITEPAQLDGALKQAIQGHLDAGDTVVCLTAGGGGSLDEWLRKEFSSL